MTDDPEWLAKLRRKEIYLTDWLDNFKGAKELAPEVQKNLEFTQWEIGAIETRPDEAAEVPFPNLTSTLDSDFEHLEIALPMMPSYDKEQFLGTSAITSSSTISVFDYAARVGDLGTEDATLYAGKITVEFRSLQERYDRAAEVRGLISRTRNPNTLARFDAAHGAYRDYRLGIASRGAAATALRTLIDGVKGDLWEAARVQPSENMTWEAMASRLSKDGQDGPLTRELLAQNARHSALVSRLSDVLKDREGGSATNVDYLWSDVLDYLVALLGLINPESFS